MTKISKTKLSELSDEIMKLNEDIVVVAIFDKSGKLMVRKLRKEYEKKLKHLGKQVEMSIIRAIMMLSIANEADKILGKTQYLLICRKNYKTLIQLFPPTDLALRITFKNKLYGKILYNQIIPILKKYSPAARPARSNK